MKLTSNGDLDRVYGKTLQGSNIISGRDVSSDDDNLLKSRNPANIKDLVGTFPISTEEEIELACAAAKDGYEKWHRVPAPVRAEIIGNFGQLVRKHKEFLSRMVTREIGKTLKESRGEVQEVIDTASYFQSEGRRLYGQTVPSELPNKELLTFRRPLGVCGIITAGNFPLAVPSWKIIPATLCGNSIVWKPSEDAPTVAYLFAKLFNQAGLPDGVLNLINGYGSIAGQNLVNCIPKGLIQKMSFTGSSKVGRQIGAVCGAHLQTPSLELGGKNPMIIMDDADLELAATSTLWAAFGTGGQRCTSLGNLIVHDSIADSFLSTLQTKMKNDITIGDPTKSQDVLYGPMMNARFLKNFERYLNSETKAKLLTRKNGRIQDKNDLCGVDSASDGWFCYPTIWDNVDIKMNLAQEETFGPMINVIRAKSFDHAMSIANGTSYGLSSAIYTDNPYYRSRFKNEIEAGMSSINNSTTGAEAHLPFGGIKGSGNGTRESGIWVIDAYTRWHAINIDNSGSLQLAQMDTQSCEPGQDLDVSGLLPN